MGRGTITLRYKVVLLVVAGVAQVMVRGDAARRACARSDARAVHVRTSDARSVNIRAIECDAQVLHGIVEQLCLQGCALNSRSRCHGPSIGLVGSGVCEIKYRSRTTPASNVAPFPHAVNVAKLSKGHARVQKRYLFSLRFGPLEIGLNFDPLGGRGDQCLARSKSERYFISQTPDPMKRMLRPCQCDRLLLDNPAQDLRVAFG